MKARPIIFNGDMVRAILDGWKTQTRRVIRKHPLIDADFKGGFIKLPENHVSKDCPYGQPGDLLYVRETWARYQTIDYVRRSSGASFYEASDGFVAYRADGFDSVEDLKSHAMLMTECYRDSVEVENDCWRPSIHMPRWASRITLEITDVRVERLQDISEEDAKAEGVEELINADGCLIEPASTFFMRLWDSIYGTWDANPWVWVVEFKPILKNVDEVIRDRA